MSSLRPLNLRAKSGSCSRKLNGETAALRLATLKIWQASCIAGALAATSLTAIHRVAVSRPSVATPNGRVADAFSAIPLNVTAVLVILAADRGEHVQHHAVDRLEHPRDKAPTLPVAMVQFERGSGGSVAVVGRDRRRRLPGGVTGDRGAGVQRADGPAVTLPRSRVAQPQGWHGPATFALAAANWSHRTASPRRRGDDLAGAVDLATDS